MGRGIDGVMNIPVELTINRPILCIQIKAELSYDSKGANPELSRPFHNILTLTTA